jgi:hypothetical protein
VNGTDKVSGFEERLLVALTEIDERRSRPGPAPPKRWFWRRRIVLAAAVTSVVAVGGAAAAVAAFDDPNTFQAAAPSVVAGDPVTLKGSGCLAGSEVRFTANDGRELGHSTANQEGTFTAEVPLSPDAPLGTMAIRASCPDGSAQPLVQRLEVTVVEEHEPLTATLALAGETTPGGEVVIKGAGCKAGTDVTFGLDAQTPLGVATAGSDGAYSAIVTVPSSLPVGSHVLTAECAGVDGEPLELTASLVVIEPEAQGPSPLPKPNG